MHKEMANLIQFVEQLSPWRFTAKLEDVHYSFIVGVAAPIMR